MPTHCVPVRQCGTSAPGWLTGGHPSVGQGAVQRRVCFHWSGSCCRWSLNIRVQNCGAFFVYELSRPPVCHLRFCGDSGLGKENVPRHLSVLPFWGYEQTTIPTLEQ